jgi:signal transduction histidine kinase
MGAQQTSMPEIGLAAGTLSAEVLSIVSHDLRSPLATISMATSLLDDLSRPEEERAQMVQMVKRATQRMERLVRDMLEVGRLDSGRTLPINARCVDVGPAVWEACEAQAPVAQAAGLLVECNVPDALPAVKVDCDRIQQVVCNLVGNAMKFTAPGGRITITARVEGDDVQVSVKDTGTGMSEEDLERIFEPYWQAQRTASLGAGLGLKIAKGIVEAHGGRIWAESAIGEGTTFHFALPVA